MRATLFGILAACAAAAVGCDIFLEDYDPNEHWCEVNDDCAGGWVCFDGDCQPRSDLGGNCDESWDWYEEGEPHPWEDCVDGLWCLYDECGEAGGDGEPCRIDYVEENALMCSEEYRDGAESACDENLYCHLVLDEEYDLVEATCVPAPGAGEACLCDYFGEPICYIECDYYEYSSGICEDGLDCDSEGSCN